MTAARLTAAYFVHDLRDAAVHRRLLMLRTGGVDVRLAGFRRQDNPPLAIDGVITAELGVTHDAQLIKRVLSVLAAIARPWLWRATVAGADTVIARNLEMLMIAAFARVIYAPKATLVYESLDIHRTLLGDGPANKILRWIERRLLAKSDRLLVSSPAFVDHYFTPRQHWRGPTTLVENKLLRLGSETAAIGRPTPSARAPWRIGWFGVIRCRKSLDMLCRIATVADGAVEVVIRGRPARTEFDDFDAQVARTPHVTFEGPYAPSDVAAHYAETHFAWAIDYFEEGLNSTWLLPNRLYEAGASGVPPIALASVATGQWLERHQAGVLVNDPVHDLAAYIAALTPEGYLVERERIARIDARDFIASDADCKTLAETIAPPAATRKAIG
jgi:succinoglycan biosynthesis protein ExoL